MADKPTYDASTITILEGLEAVRKRPGMYIGSTGERGLRHMVYQTMDSAVHEVLAGCAEQIHITLLADGGVRVVDDGCGVPVDARPDGIPVVEALMTTLYCGHRFGEWSVSGWHEEVPGAPYSLWHAVVNALSQRLEVEVRRQGYVWHQSYHRGVRDAPLAKGEPTTATGTTITFWPDPEIFGPTVLDAEVLQSRMRQLAFLTPRLSLTLTDERDGHTDTVTSSGDLTDYVTYLNQVWDKEPIHAQVIKVEAEDVELRARAEIVMQWTDSPDDLLHTYANTILTPHGGTHEQGFREAVTSVVAQYARDTGLCDDENIPGCTEVFQGLTAVVHVVIPDPTFAGPTTTCLDNPEVKAFVAKVVTERLSDWLTCHPAEAQTIVGHVVQAAAQVPAAIQQAVLDVLTEADEQQHHPAYDGTTGMDVVRRSGLTAPQVRRALTALVADAKVCTSTYYGDDELDKNEIDPAWAYTFFVPRADA